MGNFIFGNIEEYAHYSYPPSSKITGTGAIAVSNTYGWGTAQSTTNGQLYLSPAFFHAPVNATTLTIRTSGSAAWDPPSGLNYTSEFSTNLCIYEHGPSAIPENLIYSRNSTISAGTTKNTNISFPMGVSNGEAPVFLKRGWYWLGFQLINTTSGTGSCELAGSSDEVSNMSFISALSTSLVGARGLITQNANPPPSNIATSRTLEFSTSAASNTTFRCRATPVAIFVSCVTI